jgi:hypothetical protein
MHRKIERSTIARKLQLREIAALCFCSQSLKSGCFLVQLRSSTNRFSPMTQKREATSREFWSKRGDCSRESRSDVSPGQPLDWLHSWTEPKFLILRCANFSIGICGKFAIPKKRTIMSKSLLGFIDLHCSWNQTLDASCLFYPWIDKLACVQDLQPTQFSDPCLTCCSVT